jgi:hypothetical protein
MELQAGMGKGGPMIVICQVLYQLLVAWFHLKVNLVEAHPCCVDDAQVVSHLI